MLIGLPAKLYINAAAAFSKNFKLRGWFKIFIMPHREIAFQRVSPGRPFVARVRGRPSSRLLSSWIVPSAVRFWNENCIPLPATALTLQPLNPGSSPISDLLGHVIRFRFYLLTGCKNCTYRLAACILASSSSFFHLQRLTKLCIQW